MNPRPLRLLSLPALCILLAAGMSVAPAPTVHAAPKAAKTKASAKPPAVDGAAVYRATCNRCHNARTLEELDPARWELAVTHMQVRGSLPQRDVEALLAWMNPPEGAGLAVREATARGAFPDQPLVAERCVRCHGVDRVQDAMAAGRDTAWWTATLARMRSYGAKLTPKEEAAIQAAVETRAESPEE